MELVEIDVFSKKKIRDFAKNWNFAKNRDFVFSKKFPKTTPASLFFSTFPNVNFVEELQVVDRTGHYSTYYIFENIFRKF